MKIKCETCGKKIKADYLLVSKRSDYGLPEQHIFCSKRCLEIYEVGKKINDLNVLREKVKFG